MTYLLGGKVQEILITPLGGISKTSIPFATSFFMELSILLFGPIFQTIAWLILIFIFPFEKELITVYHFSILIFNLLPIYPLDGGKIFCLFLQLFFSFRKAYFLVFFISFCILILFFFYAIIVCSFNVMFFTVFLFVKLIKEIKNYTYLYEKFLLERYLHPSNFSKSKVVFSVYSFKRWYRHLIKIGNIYYLEREYLEKRYKNC